jgi:dipeptidyl aminopeptidase/acylaminoacyl peptidase
MKNVSKLIPREILFSNPDKAGVAISPDGKYISYLEAYEGYLNIFIAPIDNLKKVKRLTADKRGIRNYFWAYDSKNILYLQDKDGDENWHIYKVDVETANSINITPFPGVKAHIEKTSIENTNQIVIGLNKRDKEVFDAYLLNINDSSIKLIYENKYRYTGYLFDDNYQLKLVSKMDQDTGDINYYFVDQDFNTSPFITVSEQDSKTTYPLGLNKKGDSIYIIDSSNKNVGDFILLNLQTGSKKIIYKSEKFEIDGISFNKKTKEPIALSISGLREKRKVLDKAYSVDFRLLEEKAKDGDFGIISKTLDETKWVVIFSYSDKPSGYYLYDRSNKKLAFLFYNRSNLLDYQLAPMQSVEIKSRDDLILPSYLTLPVGFKPGKSKPIPLILDVHGGPTARDYWGYNGAVQWLVNRGYAVLQVNYRGSLGFGKEFVNAGKGEWAAKMHDDLIDACKWAIMEGITTREQIAISGGSYGGYAALVGLTFTPNYFKCAVDIVGPSNLVTLLESIPPYWKPFMKNLELMTGGDVRTEKGKQFLKSRSPLTYYDKIIKPLLIAQGANDPRVKQAESDQIVSAMKKRNIPVTYILYPDEGHGFAKPENRKSYIAITEQFLAKHLGGRAEPIHDEIEKSSVQIMEGKALILG